MLLKIREATAGKFSYFIIAIISVPFAFWGINYYFQGGGPVAIEVGSTEISLARYNEAFNQRKRVLQTSLGPDQMPSDAEIRRDVVSAFVREQLLEDAVEKYRYRVSDAEVADTIMAMPEFMNEGEFDRQQYANFLKADRQNQSQFENSIRAQLQRSQLYRAIEQSDFSLPYEEDTYKRILYEERHIRYLEFPVEHFADRVDVPATEVQTYYEEHKQEFVDPDEFLLRYIELKMEDIVAGLNPEEDELRAYYDDNPDLFTEPEQRTVAHILIDPDRHENAEQRAYEVYEKLEGGEDFAALAKMYSDDSLTADKGGELLPLTREDLDGATREVVFSLASGEFSEPVFGDFGWQVFKLLSVEGFEEKPFEEVRDAVTEEFVRQQAEEIYGDTLDEIEAVAYEKNHLHEVLNKVELVKDVHKTGRVKVDDKASIFRYPEVVEAAYSDEVMNQMTSPVLEVEPGYVIVVQGGGGAKGPLRPGKQKAFNQVESEITQMLRRDKAWNQALKAIEETAKDLRENATTMDRLAAEQSLPLHDIGFVRRGELKEMPAIEHAAFLIQGDICRAPAGALQIS